LREPDVELLESAVRTAGTIVRNFTTQPYKTWRKSDGSPVSEADLAVNRYLNQTLRPARPDYGWLSEESEDDPARLHAKRVFVIDPIDGTVAFLKGHPHFTICAAVVEGERPIAAAVYNPLMDECFTAAKGEFVRLNGKSIRVSHREALDGSRILASKTVLDDPQWDWPPLYGENRNSSAYRIALVACGTFDGTISLTAKHDWDIAAAELIAEEAGGIVTTHEGAPIRYNGVAPVQPSAIAAGPALHAAIIARLNRKPGAIR
jgi:myo-inositol-1(or 4)-monophosphatase